MRLLKKIHNLQTPQGLGRLPEVEILREIWEQHYEVVERRLLPVRDPKGMPEAAYSIESPYEPEAHYSTKRSMSGVGYKAYLTETYDEEFPHLITNVRTTAATTTDVKQPPTIQDGLFGNGLL